MNKGAKEIEEVNTFMNYCRCNTPCIYLDEEEASSLLQGKAIKVAYEPYNCGVMEGYNFAIKTVDRPEQLEEYNFEENSFCELVLEFKTKYNRGDFKAANLRGTHYNNFSGRIKYGDTDCIVEEATFRLVSGGTVSFESGTVVSGDIFAHWYGGTFKGGKFRGWWEGGTFESGVFAGAEVDTKNNPIDPKFKI